MDKSKIIDNREGYKKTELGWIPEEWEIVKINDLVDTLKSGLSRSLKDENVGIPCIRSNNIKNNRLVLEDLKYWFRIDDKGAKIEDYILKEGDILINFINSISQIGKGCIFNRNDVETIYTTNLLRIQVDENKIINKYFYYYTQTEHYKKEVNLITKPAVNQASFTTVEYKAIKFPVPPLKEQEKLAEILSTVDTQIDDTDKLIEKTKELKKGLMQRLLTKGIGHKEFKKTEIGEIPVEWEIRSLGEICDLIDGDRSKSYPSPSEIVNEGILFLSTSNIKNNKLVYGECKFITEEKFNSLRKGKLEKDDLIITLRGSIGSVAIFNSVEYQTGFINAQMLIVRSLGILPEYLWKYLISDVSKKQIEIISSGSAQPQLTKRDLSNLKVGIPMMKEQQQIASILLSIDTQIDEYENKKSKLEELKKGLMQQLLTGKIRTIK